VTLDEKLVNWQPAVTLKSSGRPERRPLIAAEWMLNRFS
jgi:hypothetical protein